MGHNKGKDNAKATKTRRMKAERLKAAKDAAKALDSDEADELKSAEEKGKAGDPRGMGKS